MKLKFKLYATLGEYLPAGTKAHTVEIDYQGSMTPMEIVEQYGVPKEKTHLILLNGIYLNSDERETINLKDGDTLAVWPPVAGG